MTENSGPDEPSEESIRKRDGIPPDASDEELARFLFAQNEVDPRSNPWTVIQKADNAGMADYIKTLIDIVGDDPEREGLAETPDRVIRSWRELYSGYGVDIGLLFTTFDADQYNEMIILEGIEFQSMCEHHMLPFIGKAWVAYIPDEKIVGISKLARLVEAFSKRLQNQERITMQVTEALDKYLSPAGSACVLKGQHMCMGCRGVKQPHAVMTTSSLTGVFQTDGQTRSEFLSFVNAR